MRVLGVLVLVLLAIAIVVMVGAYLVNRGVGALRRQQQQVPRGKWQPLHFAEDGHTIMVVARVSPEGHVIEKSVVARIADSDEKWGEAFLQAKLDAEERAFHLNGDGPQQPP